MKSIKRITSFLLVALLFVTTVFAGDYTTIDTARTIKTNGQAVTYKITQDDSTYYGKFSVGAAGLVKFTIKKPYQGKLSYKIVASDKETVILERDVNTTTSVASEYLPKGTFYIVITRHDGAGNATVAINYSKLANVDAEPNNSRLAR